MNKTDFRAIEIIPGKDCHCALSKHAGERMLCSEVLELLTDSHSYSSCSCVFKHYEDRRKKGDRRQFTVEQPAANIHQRTRPYGRRVVDIHNRSRDQFAQQRQESSQPRLQIVA